MAEHKYFSLLNKAYKLTDNVTPRRFDCGKLCGCACCGNLSHSTNITSGMALLPYEKQFLISQGAESYSFKQGDDGNILVCSGMCDRTLRPFACRIFPYYASISGNCISIKKDPRAASVCPLLTSAKYHRVNIRFLRNIKKAVRLLVKEEEFRDDFLKTAEFIDSLYELYSKIK